MSDGAASAVDAMFGKEGGEQPAEEQAKPSDPNRPEWAPENFWAEGKLDAQALAKSWRDGRAEITRLQQAAKAAPAGGEELPEAPDGYWKEVDFGAIEKASPKAFASMGGGEGKSTRQFLTVAHRNGIGPEKARTMLGEYLSTLEADVPDSVVMSDADKLKAAIGGLGPNGPRIADDVHAWLRAQEERQVFNEDQMGVLGTLVRDKAGLSLLYELVRQRQDAGPPAANGAGMVDVASEAKDVFEAMKDPMTWRDPNRRADIERRFEALNERGAMKEYLTPSTPVL